MFLFAWILSVSPFLATCAAHLVPHAAPVSCAAHCRPFGYGVAERKAIAEQIRTIVTFHLCYRGSNRVRASR
jgi:hypothetical protein